MHKRIASILFLLLFLLILVLVKTVDVQAIGPDHSSVGLADLNGTFHGIFGYLPWLYQITEYAGYLALLTAAGFGVYIAVQLIRRKQLKAVDRDLYWLVGLYAVVALLYVLFEKVVINCRPVIVDEVEGLEASFPSTHTMLSICILVPAMEQFHRRLKSPWQKPAVILSGVLMAVIILGRLFSGVHWLTDIVASLFLGSGLVLLYLSLIENKKGQTRA